MRPRCIGTERTWTQLLFCSLLFYSFFLRNQHWNSFRNKSLLPKIWRRGRIVTLPIRLWDGRFGFRIVGGVKGVFFPYYPQRPGRIWVPPSLLYYGHRCYFTGYGVRGNSYRFSAEVQNEWSCTLLPLRAVMVWTETTVPFLCSFSLNCSQYFKYFNFIFAPKKYIIYFAGVFA